MSVQFPMYAYAMLVPAALLLLGIMYLRRRAQAFAALGQARHFAYLQPRKWWLAYGSVVVLVGCSLLAAVALLNPRRPMPAESGTLAMAGTDVAVAMDVSNSMLAADLAPSRLLQAARLLQMLTDTLANNRISFTAFAGEAYLQMPLTTDLQAAASMAGTLSPGMVPVQGTSLAEAMKVAAASLQRSQAARKAMILITDGETHDEASSVVADSLREQGIMLIAIGMGHPEGALLTDEKGIPIRDEEGNQVVSRLNEPLLQELAAATSGEYHRFTRAETMLADVLNDLKGMEQKKLVNASMLQHRSYAGWLLWPACLWLLGSWLWGKWSARRGMPKPALAALALLLLPAWAWAQQPDLTKARKAYEAGNLASAEQGFLQVLRHEPDQEVAHFYLGNIYYKQNRYAEAAKHYEQSRSYQQQKKERASSSNNLGLAQANAGQLDEAIDALKTALRNSPYDADIQHNLNVALQQKKKQNRQQPPQPQQPPRKPDPKMDALEKEEQKARQKQQQQQPSARGDTKKW